METLTKSKVKEWLTAKAEEGLPIDVTQFKEISGALLLGLNDDMLEKSCGVVRQVSLSLFRARALSPPHWVGLGMSARCCRHCPSYLGFACSTTSLVRTRSAQINVPTRATACSWRA